MPSILQTEDGTIWLAWSSDRHDSNPELLYRIGSAIPGDVNGDGTVDIIDLGLLAEDYGLTSASPNWNENADINNDGAVDIFDIGITSANWG